MINFLQDWESKKPVKAIAALKKSQSYQLTMAYLDGINQYLDEGKTPIEFSLVGIKQKFTITDVYNIFGYMSFSFAMAQNQILCLLIFGTSMEWSM
jgi:acyl-homoserine lactone acylase PvdQ